jgi:hypothetical protein
MTTKITVIYDNNPREPTALEAGFPDQVALAEKSPGASPTPLEHSSRDYRRADARWRGVR